GGRPKSSRGARISRLKAGKTPAGIFTHTTPKTCHGPRLDGILNFTWLYCQLGESPCGTAPGIDTRTIRIEVIAHWKAPIVLRHEELEKDFYFLSSPSSDSSSSRDGRPRAM